MFEDCGKKIQDISVFFLVIGWIAVFIFSIVFAKDQWGNFNFWKFIGILLGGGFLVYVDAFLLNGFGRMVENSEAQRTVLERTERKREKEEKEAEREKKKKEEQEILDNGGWKCVCGRVNKYNYCLCRKSRQEGEIKEQL